MLNRKIFSMVLSSVTILLAHTVKVKAVTSITIREDPPNGITSEMQHSGNSSVPWIKVRHNWLCLTLVCIAWFQHMTSTLRKSFVQLLGHPEWRVDITPFEWMVPNMDAGSMRTRSTTLKEDHTFPDVLAMVPNLLPSYLLDLWPTRGAGMRALRLVSREVGCIALREITSYNLTLGEWQNPNVEEVALLLGCAQLKMGSTLSPSLVRCKSAVLDCNTHFQEEFWKYDNKSVDELQQWQNKLETWPGIAARSDIVGTYTPDKWYTWCCARVAADRLARGGGRCECIT